jgi:hypothetical protein
MRFALVLSAAAVALAAISYTAGAQSTAAGKPPDAHTTLPPELSPPLSALQLAKQAMIVPTAAPIGNTGPAAGIKAAPFSTSLPPDPKLAELLAKASAAKLQLTSQLVQHDLAIAQGRTLGPFTNSASLVKPTPMVTELPSDPSTAGARAQALANKLAHVHSTASTRAGTKPPPLSTNGPAPSTLSPEQVAKRAQAAASPRRPQ